MKINSSKAAVDSVAAAASSASQGIKFPNPFARRNDPEDSQYLEIRSNGLYRGKEFLTEITPIKNNKLKRLQNEDWSPSGRLAQGKPVPSVYFDPKNKDQRKLIIEFDAGSKQAPQLMPKSKIRVKELAPNKFELDLSNLKQEEPIEFLPLNDDGTVFDSNPNANQKLNLVPAKVPYSFRT